MNEPFTIAAAVNNERILEQILKQLNKLIDVIKVTDFADKEFVEREMCLIKINAPVEHRSEALRIADIFRARVVDSTQKSYTFQVTGDEKKIAAFIELLKPMGIKEIVRTGKVAITRE